MRREEQLVKNTQLALDDVCRAAIAVPADKRTWSPGGAARSTLDQMREVAASADWLLAILESGKAPDPHRHGESDHGAPELGTVEECIEAARTNTPRLCQLIASYPADKLENEIVMPFSGATTMTMADVMGLHYWNLVYHLGQINQIQLILGDRVMH
ncbi:MAG: hypothetical protein HYR64_10415 [Fimbriimonas ginsengisoli]|uniref:DinB-like domain-containing protein n=1 Tax=Fimbriimonas ginsengisoli TaxID=1005039 RepID=A0A931LXA7_FIMGI|nr:hypothetical protein [Fimbriimonas ginsengisoli]